MSSPVSTEVHDAPRPTASKPFPTFYLPHLIVLLSCWFPLNPIVIESFRNPNFGFRFNLEVLVGVLSMLAGPFAPWLFPQHAEIATSLILIACSILAVGLIIQLLWRPMKLRYEIIRQLLWAVTCWLWLASAFVAFAAAM